MVCFLAGMVEKVHSLGKRMMSDPRIALTVYTTLAVLKLVSIAGILTSCIYQNPVWMVSAAIADNAIGFLGAFVLTCRGVNCGDGPWTGRVSKSMYFQYGLATLLMLSSDSFSHLLAMCIGFSATGDYFTRWLFQSREATAN